MKKTILTICVAMLTTSVFACNFDYIYPEPYDIDKVLPRPTYVQPDGRGGYTIY